ncbi:Cytidine deaminase, partial [Haemophilus influenzae]
DSRGTKCNFSRLVA